MNGKIQCHNKLNSTSSPKLSGGSAQPGFWKFCEARKDEACFFWRGDEGSRYLALPQLRDSDPSSLGACYPRALGPGPSSSRLLPATSSGTGRVDPAGHPPSVSPGAGAAEGPEAAGGQEKRPPRPPPSFSEDADSPLRAQNGGRKREGGRKRLPQPGSATSGSRRKRPCVRGPRWRRGCTWSTTWIVRADGDGGPARSRTDRPTDGGSGRVPAGTELCPGAYRSPGNPRPVPSLSGGSVARLSPGPAVRGPVAAPSCGRAGRPRPPRRRRLGAV